MIQCLELTVAYKRHFGSYSDRGIENNFQKLAQWAVVNSLGSDATMIGIPWDDLNVTDQERCRFDCCIAVPEGSSFRGINTQAIPSGNYAVLRHEVMHHDIEKPWDELMRVWLPSSGLFPMIVRDSNDTSRTDPQIPKESGSWNSACPWLRLS